MSANWRDCVNQRLGKVSVASDGFIKSDSTGSKSPIDIFYDRIEEMVRFGSPDLLNLNSFSGPLLLVGLVSATEDYFRSMFGVCIDLCQICQRSSADQKISLGSAIWQGDQHVARGALEHLSLADAQAIRSSSEKFLRFLIKKGTDVDSALDEFDKVCQLRHGIVHAASRLPGTNALKLGVPAALAPAVIAVGYPQLQDVASACRSLVCNYNIALFDVVARRWIIDWNPRRDKALFKRLWAAFVSRRDIDSGGVGVSLSMVRCRNLIEKEFP